MKTRMIGEVFERRPVAVSAALSLVGIGLITTKLITPSIVGTLGEVLFWSSVLSALCFMVRADRWGQRFLTLRTGFVVIGAALLGAGLGTAANFGYAWQGAKYEIQLIELARDHDIHPPLGERFIDNVYMKWRALWPR